MSPNPFRIPCQEAAVEEGLRLSQSSTSREQNATYQLKGALGVIEVEISPRFSVFGLGPTIAPSNSLLERVIGRFWSWVFQIESRHDVLTAAEATLVPSPPVVTTSIIAPIEISWSRAKGVKAGDIILAVGDQLVIGQSLEKVKQLIQSASPPSSSATLRLTLDTRAGWGSTTQSRSRLQHGHWIWRFIALLDGFEMLLDARTCPQRKLGLNGLAMCLLLPLMESFFSALNSLSSDNGLFVSHTIIVQYEVLWSIIYLSTIIIVAVSCRLTPKAPTAMGQLMKRLVLLLKLVICMLGIPSLLIIYQILTTGFDLPTVTTDAALETELQSLITNVLCVLVLPFVAAWYLLRLTSFSNAYAEVLISDKPRLLGLNMPLSSHFVAKTERHREIFHHLRWYGY